MSEVLFPEILEEGERADIVFVGEIHSAESHHALQLEVIKSLKEAGVPVAIGLEMFRASDQNDLDRWVLGGMKESEFKKAYRRNWKIPWGKYEDIFRYARKNKVPLVGLNISRKIIHQVFQNGFASLTPEELKEIPGITCDVDREYEEFIRRAMKEHDISGASFLNFCEAQMVWDTAMAQNAVDYLKKNPGMKMVVLAGGGHSWKRGIPEQVKRRSDLKSLVILPEMPDDKLAAENITFDAADYIWVE
ncbi:MAG: ChaN family lipoprotein [Deltaproteobacteria bacterium]|nr:ChaN family lipoprotein [Deltaproteobacteria bacterium]